MKLHELQKYQHLIDAGLTMAEIKPIHTARQKAAADRGDKPVLHRMCPGCGHCHEDTGEAITHCHCGYCRHAVLDNTPDGFRCNHCDAVNPVIPEMTPAHFEVHDLGSMP